MKNTSVAHKYAKALFEEALAKEELLACQQGLEEIVRVARMRDSLRRILAHPFIAGPEKKAILRAALGEYATPLLKRFLNLVVEKRRFDLLFAIAQEFQDEVDRYQKVQAIHVRTALPMTEGQRKTLKDHLETWLRSKVRMGVQVDSQLIGGLVIQTQDRECDQSLKGQLKRLQQQLTI